MPENEKTGIILSERVVLCKYKESDPKYPFEIRIITGKEPVIVITDRSEIKKFLEEYNAPKQSR